MFLKIIPKRIKVWLIKHLYTDIAAMGDGGDTALAHVNEKEVALLKAHGGAGTINPRTGLIEFKGKGGGGSPAPTTQESVSYSSNLPEYAEPYYKEQMKQVAKEVYTTDSAGNVTGVKPSAVYKGPRVAGFRTDQTSAQDQTRALRDPAQIARGTNALANSTDYANYQMRQGLGRADAYRPDTITSEDVTETITDDTLTTDKFTDPGIAANYMNPYQQQVVDVQTAEARRQADIAKASRGLGSIGRGTFGGGRQALMESEADRALATQLGQIQATGSQQAYQQGQQAFTQDQARGLQADTANQAADLRAQQLMQQGQKYNQDADLQMQGMQQTGDQFSADLSKQLGLAGLQGQLTGGSALGQLGALDQQTDLQRIQALAASGGEQQRMDQEYLNANKQRFLEEENARKAALEYQSNILRGTAGALGSTQTQYAPAPSMASQIGGLGLAGLGLYNKLS
tara:strand:- start:796 stop:2166 length:1371 start_codon:yes stop_codon:yes gene_type:complete